MSKADRLDGPHDRSKKPAMKSEEPPGDSNKWAVIVLDAAKKEGHRLLTDTQYEHIVEIVKRLTDFGNAEELRDLDIQPISSFWELREKWGPLGKINLRIYFGTMPEVQELIIAKAYKKEEEGQTPAYVIVSVENRLDTYREVRLQSQKNAKRQEVLKE
jgi:hypothetical protein